MTKKDYIKIASALNTIYVAVRTQRERENLYILVDSFCTVCQQDNTRFDKDKFLNAVYGIKNNKQAS